MSYELHIYLCAVPEGKLGTKNYFHFFFRRIFNIDTHVGMAAAGLISDARSVAQIARDEAASYRSATC
jgi:20S proteasome alpha/beta subunit